MEEHVDMYDSNATSDDNDDSVAQPFTSGPTASEPVIAVVYGKIACETCGKRFKPRGMNITYLLKHKAMALYVVFCA